MTVPVEDELSVVLSNSIISTDYSPISTSIYSLLYIFVTSSRYVLHQLLSTLDPADVNEFCKLKLKKSPRTAAQHDHT
jgi:hypothetical protein